MDGTTRRIICPQSHIKAMFSHYGLFNYTAYINQNGDHLKAINILFPKQLLSNIKCLIM